MLLERNLRAKRLIIFRHELIIISVPLISHPLLKTDMLPLLTSIGTFLRITIYNAD